MIIDTHAHYDDAQFESDREEILTSLLGHGIEKAIDVSSTAGSLDAVAGLMRKYKFIYGAFGLHPDETGDLTPENVGKIKAYLSDPKAVAVGEIGLDYHWMVQSKETQAECFRKQLALALEFQKPVILHSRDAAEDTLNIIKEIYGKGGPGWKNSRKGVMHCYSYSPKMARIYTSMGFYLGIGGVVTYKNSKKLKETVRETPLCRILLETDCPYLSPEPNRGKRNSSLNLPYVVQAIADIKDCPAEEVEEAAENNAMELFRF